MARDAPASVSGERIALPLSGDDPKSKGVVSELISSIGFEPVDIGTIGESWRQEPGAPLYCTDLSKEEVIYWYPMINRKLLPSRREQLVHLYFTWPKEVTLEGQLKEARSIFREGLN